MKKCIKQFNLGYNTNKEVMNMGRTIRRTQKTENGLIVKLAHYKGEWVAEITGTDPKYKFARTFLDPIEEDWSASGETGWSYYKLENGKIYQVNEPYGGRYFIEADGCDWYDIEETEVLARWEVA